MTVCSAQKFYSTFSPSLLVSHHKALHRLSTLLLPAHVQSDEQAQRFRNEKYAIRMSRSGFGLLIGWLTEGVGGEAFGAGDGFRGEKGKRGRASVMRVVNNHLRFDGNCAFSAYYVMVFVLMHKYSHLFKPFLRISPFMGGVYGPPFIVNSPTKWNSKPHQRSDFQCLKRRFKAWTNPYCRRTTRRE